MLKKSLKLFLLFSFLSFTFVACELKDDNDDSSFDGTTVTFEDLGLAANSYWNGSDGSGKFTSCGVEFMNKYDPTYSSWAGSAYSNKGDVVTSGYTNQYSSYTGCGYNSSTYALFFLSDPSTYKPEYKAVSFLSPTTVHGFYVANTTYAYLAMLNGDAPAKKFGGTTGNDADWFKLTVKGLVDNKGTETAESVEFYLADYRFADNSKDYIVKDWTFVDLTKLGTGLKGLKFYLSSSDNGSYGMNTPAYFAMDNLMYKAD